MSGRERRRERGIALVVAMLVLTIVSVMAMSIGSIGIMHLNNQSNYRSTMAAKFTARAAVAEALYRATVNNSYGQAAGDSFTITLSNNVPATVNFVAGSRYSVNNMAGIAPVNDGMGDPVPMGFMKVNGFATVGGKTEVASVLATLGLDGDYAVLTQQLIDVGSITGNVRNNYTTSGPSISLASLTGTATTTDPDLSSITVTNGTGTKAPGAPPYTIPDVPVQAIIDCKKSPPPAGCPSQYGGPAVLQRDAAWLAAAGMLDANVLCPAQPSCTIYVEADGAEVTLNGNAPLQLFNGIQLYVNGSIRSNGQIESDLSPKPQAIFVKGYLRVNGSSEQFYSIFAGGTPTTNSGLHNNSAIVINGSSITKGLVYARSGNIGQNGNSTWTGNVIAKALGQSPDPTNEGKFRGNTTNITYDPQYMLQYIGYFPPGTMKMKAKASW